ncbi:hypothetical protein KM043_015658 [Ampulex compressa]|nr:hypothetical protein KM043_015658 [Ampulex compressa]
MPRYKDKQCLCWYTEYSYTEHPDISILSMAGELWIQQETDDPLQAGDSQNQGECIEGGLLESRPIIARCVVTTAEIGQTIPPMLNIIAEAITIKAGDMITREKPFEEQKYEREVNEESVLSSRSGTMFMRKDNFCNARWALSIQKNVFCVTIYSF